MISGILEKIGRRCGITIVPDWRAVRLSEERHLSKLLRYLNIDCVFDVGANVGQYAGMLRKHVGFDGTIISFEPNPIAFEKLKLASRDDNSWHCENFAFGSAIGTADFQAYEKSDLGSFHEFKSSVHAPANMKKTTISVTVDTIENYFPRAKERWNIQRPFLKLDTQGHDMAVAIGAGDLLKEFLGLQSEVSFQTIYEDSPDFIEAISFYKRSGFTISRLVPIHEIHFPHLVEMDVIMIRSDIASKVGRAGQSQPR